MNEMGKAVTCSCCDQSSDTSRVLLRMMLCSDVSGAAICLPVCACCTGAEGLHSKCRQADTPQQSHPVTADVTGRGKGRDQEVISEEENTWQHLSVNGNKHLKACGNSQPCCGCN